VILPDGNTILLLTQLNPIAGVIASLIGNPALFPAVNALVQPTQGFTYTFTGFEAPGTYHVIAALVQPGSFADGRIDEGDIVELAWEAFRFSPLPANVLAIRERHSR
jgi:hypothetical protein